MYRGIYWGYFMGTLLNEISSRAVSAGNTQADFKSKRAADNPFAARNNANIWGSRTFDDARLAKKEEMKKKALFNFEKAFTIEETDTFVKSTKEFTC